MSSGAGAAERRPRGEQGQEAAVEWSCRWLLRLVEDCLQGRARAGGCTPPTLLCLLAQRHQMLLLLPRLMDVLNTGVRSGVLEQQAGLYRLTSAGQQPQRELEWVWRRQIEGERQRERSLDQEQQQQQRERDPDQEQQHQQQRERDEELRRQRLRARRRRQRWRRRRALCVLCGEVHSTRFCASAAVGPAAAEQCAICLETAGVAGGGSRAMLRCGHGFHYKCVARWCRERRNCPLCRRSV